MTAQPTEKEIERARKIVAEIRQGSRHAYDIVAESLAAARADAMEWQPIDTAPEDGRDTILANDRTQFVGIGGWFDGDHGDGPHWIWEPVEPPTHWQPLPPPPSLGETK